MKPGVPGRALGMSLAPQIASGGGFLERAARVSLVGLFMVALLHVFREAAVVLVPIVAAFVIGLVLGPAAGRMERRGVPSFLAAFLLVGSLIGVLWSVIYAFSLPLQSWLERAPDLWTTLQVRAFEFRAMLFRLEEVSQQLEDVAQLSQEEAPRVVLDEGGILSSAALTAPAIAGQLALFLVMLLFYLATRTQIRHGLLSLCMDRRAKLKAGRIMRDVERRVSTYLATITVINLSLGIVTALAMAALGMPSPALWGALAAALNYMPYLGPAIMTIILAGVGFITFDTIGFALVPPLVFFAINFVEGNIVTPSVLGSRFTISPLLILIALSFWLWLWGPIGALLAAPLLIVLIVLVTHLALPHIARREAMEERRRVMMMAEKRRATGGQSGTRAKLAR